jgi:hypothetical protein
MSSHFSENLQSKLAFSGLLLVLFLDSENGGSTFLRNVGELLPYYTTLHPRRLESSFTAIVYIVFTLVIFRRHFSLKTDNFLLRRVWDGKFNLSLQGHTTSEKNIKSGKDITLFIVGSFVLRYDFFGR